MEIDIKETIIKDRRIYVSVLRDISEEVKMQEAIIREKEKLNGILLTRPIGVSLTVNGNTKFANPAM